MTCILPKSKKATLARKHSFDLRIREIVLNLGAVETRESNRFVLDTKAGLLSIKPYGDWIACRFDEPARAKSLVAGPINPYSGKWNWHGDDVIPYFERNLWNLMDDERIECNFESALSVRPEIHIEQAADGKWNFRHDDNEEEPDDEYFAHGCYPSKRECVIAAFEEYKL